MKKIFVLIFLIVLFLFFKPIDFKIFSTEEKKHIDFNELLEKVKEADVLFLGEYHNDRKAHRFEEEILKALYRVKKGKIILSLEMFERDVQGVLSNYLKGKISEEEFLRQARPWGNYKTDYKPMVEFAKEKGIKVIASNVPRRYASMVARGGINALNKLSTVEKAFISKKIYHNFPRYRELFFKTMDGMRKGPMRIAKQMKENFYLAQCLKDSTMAESIFNVYREHKGYLILHVNGCFHSDYKLGTVAVLKALNKDIKIFNIKVIKTEEFDKFKNSDIADYLVY